MRRFVLLLAVWSLLGVAAPASALTPLNVCIAKTRTGPCKSSVQNTDFPPTDGTNPQVQTKQVRKGHTASFFIKVHNPNGSKQEADVVGLTDNGYVHVKYFLGRRDVTSQMSSCGILTIGPRHTALIKMRVHVDSYISPPNFVISFKLTVTGSGCSSDADVV